jgi:hypothetical protein
MVLAANVPLALSAQIPVRDVGAERLFSGSNPLVAFWRTISGVAAD